MLIDVKKLFDFPGKKLAIRHTLILNDVEIWNQKPFASPINISGEAVNRAGIVTLAYSADFILSLLCDRCAKDVNRHTHLSMEHILVPELSYEDNDEFLVVSDGVLDLSELVRSDLLLELPAKTLCSADCKGLCVICGYDLNIGLCGCKH